MGRLGEKRSGTTEIYIHESNIDSWKIRSTMDFILNQEAKENE